MNTFNQHEALKQYQKVTSIKMFNGNKALKHKKYIENSTTSIKKFKNIANTWSSITITE